MTRPRRRSVVLPMEVSVALALFASGAALVGCANESDCAGAACPAGSVGAIGPSRPGGDQATGNPGHDWCAADAEAPPVDFAHVLDVWAASFDDAWFVINDPKAGRYPLHPEITGDRPVVDTLFYFPKVAHWNGKSFCKTNFNRLYAKDDPQRYRVPITLWGAAANDLWLGGDDGLLMHWDGRTWDLRESPTEGTVYQILGTRADNIYLLAGPTEASKNAMFRYDGRSWSRVDTSALTGQSYMIWIDGKERVWGINGKLDTGCDAYRFEPSGELVCSLSLKAWGLYSVKRIDGHGETPWVLAEDQRLNMHALRFPGTDGEDWETFSADKGVDVFSLRAFSASEIWLGGMAEIMRFNGQGFDREPVPNLGRASESWIVQFFGADPGQVWGLLGGVLGGEGVMYNRGGSWRRLDE